MLSTEDMMAKNVGSKAAEVVKSMDVDLSRLGSVGFQGKLLPDCRTAGLPQHASSSRKES